MELCDVYICKLHMKQKRNEKERKKCQQKTDVEPTNKPTNEISYDIGKQFRLHHTQRDRDVQTVRLLTILQNKKMARNVKRT